MREKFRRITAVIASGGRDNAVRFTKACLRGRRTHVDARANERFEGPDADAVIKILIASTPIRDRAIFKASMSSGVDPDGAINVRTLKLGLENSMAVGPIEGKVEFENVADSYFFKGFQGAWSWQADETLRPRAAGEFWRKLLWAEWAKGPLK